MKTVLIVAILFAIDATSAEVTDAGAGVTNTVRLTPAYINQLVGQMRTNHPALRALDARVRAGHHATAAIRTWEDPTAKFGGVVASDRGPDLEEEGDLVYGLDQKLPLFGKAAAARRVATAEAEAETARHSMQFQFLRRDLSKLLFKTGYEEQVIDVGRQDLAWLETMVATAEERYRAGSASQVEVLRLQNERARRTDLLRTDVQRRDHSVFALNRLLNLELNSSWPRLALPPPAPPVPYTPSLVGLAVRNEPQLRLKQREIAAAEARVAATRKARLPDLTAGIEGRQYSGDGAFREGMFTVSFSLPWFNQRKYRSDIAREQALLDSARDDAHNDSLTIREEVHQLTVALDAARREALLYRDEILPRARQALESAHANWLANRGMFNDVMEARRMVLEAQLMSARAVGEQYQALSELVLCCGLGDFEALELFGLPPDGSSTKTNRPNP